MSLKAAPTPVTKPYQRPLFSVRCMHSTPTGPSGADTMTPMRNPFHRMFNMVSTSIMAANIGLFYETGTHFRAFSPPVAHGSCAQKPVRPLLWESHTRTDAVGRHTLTMHKDGLPNRNGRLPTRRCTAFQKARFAIAANIVRKHPAFTVFSQHEGKQLVALFNLQYDGMQHLSVF